MQSVLPGAVRVTQLSTLRWCVTLQSRRIGIDSEKRGGPRQNGAGHWCQRRGTGGHSRNPGRPSGPA